MAKAEQTPDIPLLKEQAARLSTYLAGINRRVTSQQALEAMTRALYGRPFNTVKASVPKPEKKPVSADTRATFWYHDLEFGDLLPVSATISLSNGRIIFGTSITPWLSVATDDELVSFLQLAWRRHKELPEDYPEPWFLRGLMAEDNPFASPETAETVKATPTDYTTHGVLAYFKAFAPQRYLAVVRAVLDGSQSTGHPWLAEFSVTEDPDQPGKWAWSAPARLWKEGALEGSGDSFETQVDAEVALADAWLDANPELFSMQANLKRIKPGSGVRK